jgi:hypothetical protein
MKKLMFVAAVDQPWNQVECPLCGAKPGYRCKSRVGWVAKHPHAKRMHAVLADDAATLGTCVAHLGPPGSTATPHRQHATCFRWCPAPDTAKEET